MKFLNFASHVLLWTCVFLALMILASCVSVSAPVCNGAIEVLGCQLGVEYDACRCPE